MNHDSERIDNFAEIRPYVRTLLALVIFCKDRDPVATCYTRADGFLEVLEQDIRKG